MQPEITFGIHDNIRLDVLIVFVGPPLASSPRPALDLIHDEYDPVLSAQVLQVLHEVLWAHQKATLALNGFNDHCGNFFRPDHLLEKKFEALFGPPDFFLGTIVWVLLLLFHTIRKIGKNHSGAHRLKSRFGYVF